MKAKAKIGVMHLQSKTMPKIASKPLGAGGQARNSFSLKALVKEPTLPGDTLILGLLGSRTETVDLCGLSRPVCGTLLQRPMQTVTAVNANEYVPLINN